MRELPNYPLLDALLHRRSRRFSRGMHLTAAPLAYRSASEPQPLAIEEEAALAFAACGVTGHALAELPYASSVADASGGGNVVTNFVARSVPSGDAIHTVAVVVINDGGAWLLRQPQDYPRSEIPALVEAARDGRLVQLYTGARTRIADQRPQVPREVPHVPPFNTASTNLGGTTVFVPVNELSALYINILLSGFSRESGYFALDERNGYRPAGLASFARSRGGHLEDDPRRGRVGTVAAAEAWLYEFAAIEQGAILQNLGLMTQALGLGGFPFFAAHPFGWCEALAFRMQPLPVSRAIGAGWITRAVLRATRRDLPVPTAIGLEREGQVLLKPYCPPYYGSMREAVLAFIDAKYAAGSGTLRDGGEATAWQDGAAVQAAIPRYDDAAVEATIAYCEYLYARYGRFPGTNGPFRTVLAYQAHHLDEQFYERFYRPEALSPTQRQHAAAWHGGDQPGGDER